MLNVNIFIVNYNSTGEINRNIELILSQNQIKSKISIFIIDNSSNFILNTINQNKNIKVINQCNKISSKQHGKGSIDHATSLNKYINSKVNKDKFVVVLDPDFYVHGEEWIFELRKYCEKMDDCVATPWHPKHESKVHKSIAAHFLMFRYNSHRYYDFSPKFSGVAKYRSMLSSGLNGDNRFAILNILRNLKRLIFWGTACDTGYKLTSSFNRKVFLIPIVHSNEIFWLDERGRVRILYALFLMLTRGISLYRITLKFMATQSDSQEKFYIEDIKFSHDRRSIK